MNIRPISEWTLYKHRLLLAYVGLGVLGALLLTLYPTEVPPGLSGAEQQSVVTSHALSFTQLPTPQQVVDLPYHALQKISTQFLGLTPYGVRLPSLLFAALTVLCLSLIIKRWFKTNVAIIAGATILTSSWFLGMARLGTPDIMIPFWTSMLILCATYVSQQTKSWHLWKALFGLSAALSLYTPYMAYLFLATLIAAIAQPHLRYLIRQSSKVGLTIGAFFFIVLLAPLGWGIYNQPSLLRDIFAIPAQLPEPLQFGRDLVQALSNIANPFNTAIAQSIMPLLSITTLCLVAAGGFRLLSDFHSVRAYVLLIWLALLIPIIGFNPGHLTVLFVPCMLVMAIGLNLVVRYWYRLFPFNPYARIFGLAPLFILVFTVMQFNYQRYVLTMLYSPEAGSIYSSDAFLAQTEANKLPKNSPLTLVVSKDTAPLYGVIADARPNTAVTTGSDIVLRPGAYIVAEDQQPQFRAANTAAPDRLIVNDRKENSLRFRLYQ